MCNECGAVVLGLEYHLEHSHDYDPHDIARIKDENPIGWKKFVAKKFSECDQEIPVYYKKPKNYIKNIGELPWNHQESQLGQ